MIANTSHAPGLSDHRFRIWTPDLILGAIGGVLAFLFARRLWGDVHAVHSRAGFVVIFGAYLGFFGGVFAIHALAILRRRWAMTILLGIAFFTVVTSVFDRFVEPRTNLLSAAMLTLGVALLGFLPLRLFGKIGPRPIDSRFL